MCGGSNLFVVKAFSSEIPSYNVVSVDHELMKAHLSYLNSLTYSYNNFQAIPFSEYWNQENRIKAQDDYLNEIRNGGAFCDFLEYWSDWVQLRLLRNDIPLFLVGGIAS